MAFQAEHVRAALLRMGQNYLKYVKYTAGGGAVVGTALSFAVMSDVKRDLLNTEKVLYPVGGCLVGAIVGTTAPVWILCAPIVCVLGTDTTGRLASALLAGFLLNGNADEKNAAPDSGSGRWASSNGSSSNGSSSNGSSNGSSNSNSHGNRGSGSESSSSSHRLA